jgi:hypothetical protein
MVENERKFFPSVSEERENGGLNTEKEAVFRGKETETAKS